MVRNDCGSQAFSAPATRLRRLLISQQSKQQKATAKETSFRNSSNVSVVAKERLHCADIKTEVVALQEMIGKKRSRIMKGHMRSGELRYSTVGERQACEL